MTTMNEGTFTAMPYVFRKRAIENLYTEARIYERINWRDYFTYYREFIQQLAFLWVHHLMMGDTPIMQVWTYEYNKYTEIYLVDFDDVSAWKHQVFVEFKRGYDINLRITGHIPFMSAKFYGGDDYFQVPVKDLKHGLPGGFGGSYKGTRKHRK